MNDSSLSKLMLAAMYVLNIGVWENHFHAVIKGTYLLLVGLVTIMTAANQWTTFKRSYHTSWIVIKIEYVFTHIIKSKQKVRHWTNKNKNQ